MRTVRKLIDGFKTGKPLEQVDVRKASTLFHALPTELWLHLCSFLHVRDFLHLCSTSRDLYQAGQDEWVWRTFLLRDCSPKGAHVEGINDLIGEHNVRTLFGRSWQWIYRSKMVDIHQDKIDMINRKFVVGFRVTKGGRYEGEWRLGKLEGLGTLMNAAGDMTYIGHFKHSEVHGHGVCLFSDGTRYEGEWRGSEAHGKGVCWYLGGKRYHGKWRQGKRSGKGTFYWSNGSWFTGKWRDDKPVGLGVHFCITTRSKSKCAWSYDFPCCSPAKSSSAEHPPTQVPAASPHANKALVNNGIGPSQAPRSDVYVK